MKKGIAILIAVLAVIGIIIGIISGSYNGLVNQQEEVENKHSVISVQLQRRADLINTVKGYSDYEQKTYTAVTEARNAVAGAKTAGEQTKAAEQLDSAISVWVNAVTEAYPDLKANENYKALQVELEGSENRIAVARKDYNDAAKSYNSSVRRFPKNIIAGMFGFEKVEYFEAQAGSESVPQVSFD